MSLLARSPWSQTPNYGIVPAAMERRLLYPAASHWLPIAAFSRGQQNQGPAKSGSDLAPSLALSQLKGSPPLTFVHQTKAQ